MLTFKIRVIIADKRRRFMEAALRHRRIRCTETSIGHGEQLGSWEWMAWCMETARMIAATVAEAGLGS